MDKPWETEPDRKQWVDEATGLDCLIVRNPALGILCGYVGVAEGHPAFKKSYDEVDFSVHGGLTYSDFCHGPICHEPEPGRPEHVWWLGFDCGHAGDYVPRMPHFGETYRDMAYVKAECTDLAKQLAEMK